MLNPIEEAEFAQLRALCIKLKVPAPPEIMIGLKVHDRNGVLIFDDTQRGHSWTRNFYNWLFGTIGNTANTSASWGAGYMNLKGVGGTIYEVIEGNYPWRTFPGEAVVADYGIILGTDDTAESTELFALGAIIPQGTGSGQFSYAAESTPTPSYNGGTTTWKTTRSRIANNNSAGSITVKEVGLASRQYALARYCLIERTVLAPTVAVAVGAQLTVTYEISMDFAAID